MEVKNFEDLEIWKDARLLTKAIYQMTKDTGFSKDFALRDQIRRASMSVMSNIAKDSNAAETKNLFNSSMLPKLRAARCARNFTWLWINRMSRRKIVTPPANRFVGYPS